MTKSDADSGQESMEGEFRPSGEEGSQEQQLITNFNEKLTSMLCLNQAIDKYEQELAKLKAEKESLISNV